MQPKPLEGTSTGIHSTLPHAVKYTIETQAIVSINMDIHQLCLYILGGAGSRGGNCIFHPRTFSCHWPQSALISTARPPRQVRLRCIQGRAALTSAASVEECDECRLHRSDSGAHRGDFCAQAATRSKPVPRNEPNVFTQLRFKGLRWF